MKWPAKKHLQNIPPKYNNFESGGSWKTQNDFLHATEVSFATPGTRDRDMECSAPHRTAPSPELSATAEVFPLSTPSAPQISCFWVQSNVGTAPGAHANGKGFLLPVYITGSVSLGGFPSAWPCTRMYRRTLGTHENHSLAHLASSQAIGA